PASVQSRTQEHRQDRKVATVVLFRCAAVVTGACPISPKKNKNSFSYARLIAWLEPAGEKPLRWWSEEAAPLLRLTTLSGPARLRGLAEFLARLLGNFTFLPLLGWSYTSLLFFAGCWRGR